MSDPVAGALVVGSEILIGKTVDTNTQLLIRTLFERGIRLGRWVIVPDSREAIGRELRRMMEDRLDLIIVSGGMGPTHDDVTIDAVAAALGRRSFPSNDSRTRLMAKWRSRNPDHEVPETTAAGIEKMSTVVEGFITVENPAGAVEGQVGTVDGVTIAILPGVPREFKAILEDPLFARYVPDSGGRRYAIEEMVFRGRESQIASVLDGLQREHPDVEIGSYPQGPMEVIVRLVGGPAPVGKALTELRRRVPDGP